METQNVTLVIPKSVLRKAKILAIEQNSSLSSLLTNLIEERVMAEDEYIMAMERQLAMMEEGFDLGTNGHITWTREELHER